MAEEEKVVDTQDDESEASNINGRLTKLETMLAENAKALEEERKASAGKDKKITELQGQKKTLEQATLSKDKLLEIREKEQEEREAEWASKNATERKELEQLKIEAMRHKVLAKLENFPPFLEDRVRGENPEEIEADARNIMNRWLKERDKVDNVRKVTGRPQSGNGKQIRMTADDVTRMTSAEKTKWAATASEEEYAEVFDELHAGQ